jgi:hypothetical protein
MFSTAGTFLFVVCGTNDCWRCVIFVVQNGIMRRLVDKRNGAISERWCCGTGFGLGWDGLVVWNLVSGLFGGWE